MIIQFNTIIPPSSNNQYALIRRGGKIYHIPSTQLKYFQDWMAHYPSIYKFQMEKNLELIDSWRTDGLKLQCNATFYFKKQRIFTKNGNIKKLDVANHLKALHDCICKLLRIDDSLFFSIGAIKKVGITEFVSVTIEPYGTSSLD